MLVELLTWPVSADMTLLNTSTVSATTAEPSAATSPGLATPLAGALLVLLSLWLPLLLLLPLLALRCIDIGEGEAGGVLE